MKKVEIKIGMKVWYYPILCGSERKAAVITSGAYEICRTTCCMIDIMTSCVNIDNLKERKEDLL